jgi:hypothetical protein
MRQGVGGEPLTVKRKSFQCQSVRVSSAAALSTRHGRATSSTGRLAGAAGFEPTHGGIKIRCLTTWRRPKNKQRFLEDIGDCVNHPGVQERRRAQRHCFRWANPRSRRLRTDSATNPSCWAQHVDPWLYRFRTTGEVHCAAAAQDCAKPLPADVSAAPRKCRDRGFGSAHPGSGSRPAEPRGGGEEKAAAAAQAAFARPR